MQTPGCSGASMQERSHYYIVHTAGGMELLSTGFPGTGFGYRLSQPISILMQSFKSLLGSLPRCQFALESIFP